MFESQNNRYVTRDILDSELYRGNISYNKKENIRQQTKIRKKCREEGREVPPIEIMF